MAAVAIMPWPSLLDLLLEILARIDGGEAMNREASRTAMGLLRRMPCHCPAWAAGR